MNTAAPEIPALAGVAALVAAFRAGVLVVAPGTTVEQMEAVTAEIGRQEHATRAALGNVALLIPSAFTTPPRAATGNHGKAVIALAASLAHGEAARRIFHTHEATCPPELIFARYNAVRAYEEAAAYFHTMEPATRAEVDALLQRLTIPGAPISELTEDLPTNGAA